MGTLGGGLEVIVIESEAYETNKVELLFQRERSLSNINYYNVLDDEKAKNRLKMTACSHDIPKQKNGVEQGQDSHFVHYGDKGRTTIGVFDGVGGWLQKGIDSGIYATELKDNVVLSILKKINSLTSILPLKNILHSAWFKTKAKGSSTACILTLADDDDVLRAVNIGDSGFMVIRKEIGTKITVFISQAQQSGFNCPYQLGKASKTGYSPYRAQAFRFRVKDGDIVVVGTDGLFDNLFPDEIVSIASTCQSLNDGVLPTPTLLARVIANMALEKSKTNDSVRPWTIGAVQAGKDRRKYLGGKYDDITVVVGCIGNVQ